MEVHITDRLDDIERNIRLLLEYQTKSRDSTLANRLDRICQEIQQQSTNAGEDKSQHSVKPAGNPLEHVVLTHESIKDEFSDITRHLDVTYRSINVARSQAQEEDSPSRARWRELDAKLDSLAAMQLHLQDRISKLQGPPRPDLHRASEVVWTPSIPSVHSMLYSTLRKSIANSSASIRLARSALGLSLDEDLEKIPAIETSIGVGYSETGVGSHEPSPVASERSFAVQATSHQGTVDFEVQTEARSGARETLRPAQWQDETDSPLTSNESSPGYTINDLRVLLRNTLASDLEKGCIPSQYSLPEAELSRTTGTSQVAEQGTSTSTESETAHRPRTVAPTQPESIGIGTSPPRTCDTTFTGITTIITSSETDTHSQSSSPLSPLFSPLCLSPALSDTGSEPMDIAYTPESPAIALPSSSRFQCELPPIDELAHPTFPPSSPPLPPEPSQHTQRSLETSLMRPPVPSMRAEGSSSPTPSLSSILYTPSGGMSTGTSKAVSRAASFPPGSENSLADPESRSRSTQAASTQIAGKLPSPRTANLPLDEVPIKPVDRPMFSSTPDDDLIQSSASASTPQTISPIPADRTVAIENADNEAVSPQNRALYLAMSGLNMNRSPSVLSDLSSSSEDTLDIQEPRNSGHCATSISSVSRLGDKRPKDAQTSQQWVKQKRRKTDLGLVTQASSGSSSMQAGEKSRRPRGRPRKHPILPQLQTAIFPQKVTQEVCEGYPGPYSWPTRVLNNRQELATIQCDKCKAWYHYACVGVKPTDECVVDEDAEYICPPCETSMELTNTYRKLRSIPLDYSVCCRPDCDVRSYSPECIAGRAYFRKHDQSWGVLYLIKWLSWPIEASTWEPTNVLHRDLGENMTEDFIREFEKMAAKAKLSLQNKRHIVVLPSFDAVAHSQLPYYARHR